MDRDALHDALDRWTEHGVIDESTADQIRQFESTDGTHDDEMSVPTDPATTDASLVDSPPVDASVIEMPRIETSSIEGMLGDRRLVAALALMGGVLVAIGVAAFLFERWESIPRGGRAALLLSVPVAAAVTGSQLRERSPLTGHGLWLLAALFTGVTAFQLAELANADVDALEPWLLLAWTTVVTVIAVGLDSRPITALGGVLGAATLVSGVTSNPFLLVGFYGGILYAAGVFAAPTGTPTVGGHESEGRFGSTLRWVGGTLAAVTVSGISIAGSPPPITDDPGTVVVALTTVVAAGVAVVRSHTVSGARYAALPAVGTPFALGVAWAFGILVGGSQLAVAIVGLGCLLGLLITLVAAAIELQDPALVNVATLGFLFGIVAILAGPITDVVSGSIALVVAGLTLLAAGLTAERGRRQLLSRIR